MRSYIAIAALAAVARAQDTITSATSTDDSTSTSSSSFSWDTSIPTDPADALDIAGIEAIPDPTYTEILGLKSQVVAYATATAISAAAADITSDPLTVFPAATTVAMNADGDSDDSSADSAVEKRSLAKRTACAPYPTVSNVYGIDVSSVANFKADKKVVSVAAAATTPDGYYRNFVNLNGSSNAYGYLGYDQLTSYNTTYCAAQCSKTTGCLAFNIYFERDPVAEAATTPGAACYVPNPFANIKCGYWGSVLDANTANNYGQMQGGFELAIAGSNGYSSTATAVPIDGCDAPLFLNTTTMNAPLRDCAGTWTYMGYKLLNTGVLDPRKCKAACDAQSAYNIANPPSSGVTPTCAGFGSYNLLKTNSTGSYPQGQMCTFYTSSWGSQYAVNKASYAGSTKYTYSTSYFYALSAPAQPVCSAIKQRDLIPSRHFRL